MKTNRNKLKLAVLSMGFVLLSSCTGDVAGSAGFWNISNSKVSSHEESSHSEMRNNTDNLLSIGVLPIFFGTIEAKLSGN